ncbi:MAG: divalent-cation tolerance protein CutA [Candidatus Diapherotrites archaeon]|uniref:Divalent-cation tolerance protein CutA n=1 Tax=Candidatus Iainarchaeum sp. TaxID=3101447 RepID=A0A8T4C7L0_9ARCH|nr:divalent-cation tolerance protein CutA [Candidatus Diapherotrites archaeon]
MASAVLIYSTFGSEKDAQKAVQNLLKMKLVGCAVMFPAKSMYWWKGSIDTAQETILLLKTTKSLVVKAKKELAKKHPYEVPCILDWPAGVNDSYLNWLMESTGKSPKTKKK